MVHESNTRVPNHHAVTYKFCTNPIIIWWTMWLRRQARISKDVLTADKYLRAEAPHAQNLRGQTRQPSTSYHHWDDLHSPPETLDPPSYQCRSKTASGKGTDNNYIITQVHQIQVVPGKGEAHGDLDLANGLLRQFHHGHGFGDDNVG